MAELSDPLREAIVAVDVAGQGEAAATAALKAKGFQVKVVHATPEWLRDDKVKAASPAQGTMAKQGSTVTLWVI